MSNNRGENEAGQGLEGTDDPSWYIHKTTSRCTQKTAQKESKIPLARRERFKLMDIASKVLLTFMGEEKRYNVKGHEVNHRTCKCHRVILTPTAQVVKSPNKNKAFFGGVMQCASVWTCPVCSAKINERKASDMRVAFNQAPELGYKVSLMTFTAPHAAADTIKDLSSKMRESIVSFWRERQIAKWKKNKGVIGNIRAFEVRYGDNGWHPHFHLIVFSKEAIFDDKDILLDKWQRVCMRHGLDKPNEYGLDIQDGSKAGDYICKFGSDGEVLKRFDGENVTWDAADEMTKGHAKKGKKGSLGPWDLLRCLDEAKTEKEKKKYHGLFLHYARAFKGVAQLKWSRGLRKVFELDKEKTDEELINEKEDKAKLLCHLFREEWRYLIKNKARAKILEIAEKSGSNGIARYFYDEIYSEKYAELSGDWFNVFYSDFLGRSNRPPDD